MLFWWSPLSPENTYCSFLECINSLKVAGGIIIVTSGFALLTGTFSKQKGMEKKKVKEDVRKREGVCLTPLEIPMFAGPGSIS